MTHLWRFSISGDRPILLIRCHGQDDMAFIQQCLRAQEYLRMKRLVIDVVILNERRHSYIQDLQHAIERIARAFTSQAVEGEDRGGIYPLAISAMSEAERVLLLTMARVVLEPSLGSLAELLHRPPATRSAAAMRPEPDSPEPRAVARGAGTSASSSSSTAGAGLPRTGANTSCPCRGPRPCRGAMCWPTRSSVRW